MSAATGGPGSRLTIGWKEFLDLPLLGLFRLKAKVDTGARTSSLHVDKLRVVEEFKDGSGELELTFLLSRRDPASAVTTRARMLRRVRVTDSGGHWELRPLIETDMVLGPVRKRIAITLTDRTGRLFRMLLGRKALEEHFLVDASAKYLLRPRTRLQRAAQPPESAPAPGMRREG